MSLSSLVYVTCDCCGNPCGGTDDMRDNAAAARSLAQARGWVQRPSRPTDLRHRPRHGSTLADVCPACQKDDVSRETSTTPPERNT